MIPRAVFHVSVNGKPIGDLWMEAPWLRDERLRKFPGDLARIIARDGHSAAYLELRQRNPDNYPDREEVKAEWFRTDIAE